MSTSFVAPLGPEPESKERVVKQPRSPEPESQPGKKARTWAPPEAPFAMGTAPPAGTKYMAPRAYLAANKGRRLSTGMHGRKQAEQKALKVSGETHESEHPIGYEVLSRHLPDDSGGRGSSGLPHQIENRAPAYQEVKQFHSAHIGTGSRGSDESSGFGSARGYRDAQLESIDPTATVRKGRVDAVTGRPLPDQSDIPAPPPSVSNAVQLNQLGYAHNPAFQTAIRDKDQNVVGSRSLHSDEIKANESYHRMVSGMSAVSFAHSPDEIAQVPVDHADQAEMHLARHAAQTGKWPVETAKEYKRLLALGKSPMVEHPHIHEADL